MGGERPRRRWIKYVNWPKLVPALLAVAVVASPPGRAADRDKVDPDFLEFLGSVDAEEAGLNDYLETADLDRQAPPPQAPKPQPPKLPPAAAPTTATPGAPASPQKSP
jgi:hypothetical protein